MTAPSTRIVATALAALVVALPLRAQQLPGAADGAGRLAGPPQEPEVRELSLEEALRESRRQNAGLQVARSREEMARAGSRAARSRLLPRVDLTSGFRRTVDPVGAFGIKLRQGVFAASDLALDALNDPEAVTDWSTGARMSWAGGSPPAWAARAAARHRAEAAGWRTRRTREATALRTRLLYYDAVRAGARVAAARAAREAARATAERFRRRREEGMLTRADLLQARAELSAAEADLVEARRLRHAARIRLGLHLGWSPDVLPAPSDTLERPDSLEGVTLDAEGRSDLRALSRRLRAAEAEEDRARLTFLPSLDAFASYRLHDPDPFGSAGTDWSVGVGVQWSLFTGFRRSAELQRAAAEAHAARVEYEQAVREARGEVVRARRAVASARRGVEATRAAWRAAREGRELMRRRFEEGLATPADLLEAEARATSMRSRSIDALAGYHVAVARLRFAAGGAGGGPVADGDRDERTPLATAGPAGTPAPEPRRRTQ